ncbi:hypothetical protein ACRQ5Q_35210 [Bradyrhizobium sp. PMVTL-01]|uniref:hypothetical protein n=1 Tax=Bradyrhizobium sp. PMVTL-01 TaxID=3434999 RepID=UPI003F70B082
MYTRTLLSTDGSDVARNGIRHGIALAKALMAKVTVIAVTESLPIDYGSGHASGWIPSQQEIDGFDGACKERAGKVLELRLDCHGLPMRYPAVSRPSFRWAAEIAGDRECERARDPYCGLAGKLRPMAMAD